MIPLGLLQEGEEADIVATAAAAAASATAAALRAEEMGLRIGRRIRMLANGAGPVLVKVDESRIAIDRGVAMRIKVRKA
ncbi:MAG TPA: FeoA family protein [Anaeromyxobacteraceae bacterium]|nr:FeoA family protein [Anaeromyxobacteraceae bacterium]